MIADEIERVLGRQVVLAVESAVHDAVAAEQSSGIDAGGLAATRELLITMLAATIITPSDGAIERAELDANRLVAVVTESLKGQ